MFDVGFSQPNLLLTHLALKYFKIVLPYQDKDNIFKILCQHQKSNFSRFFFALFFALIVALWGNVRIRWLSSEVEIISRIKGCTGWGGGFYSSFRHYEVQILIIKLLWCGHLARTKCTSLKLNLLPICSDRYAIHKFSTNGALL